LFNFISFHNNKYKEEGSGGTVDWPWKIRTWLGQLIEFILCSKKCPNLTCYITSIRVHNINGQSTIPPLRFSFERYKDRCPSIFIDYARQAYLLPIFFIMTSVVELERSFFAIPGPWLMRASLLWFSLKHKQGTIIKWVMMLRIWAK
jgi:hypothetical protein